MRYFFDAEFLENGPGQPLHLLSIGVVSEDGREFYGINMECPLEEANAWVREHVLPHLSLNDGWDYRLARDEMARKLIKFCGLNPEFWSYYGAYDWVVLCQVFGTMMDLPDGWPMFCHDLRAWLDDQDLKKIKQPDDSPHNALEDARWIASCWRRHHAEGR